MPAQCGTAHALVSCGYLSLGQSVQSNVYMFLIKKAGIKQLKILNLNNHEQISPKLFH